MTENHTVYIHRVKHTIHLSVLYYWYVISNNWWINRIGVVEIQPERSLEIDTIEDLHYARFLAPKLLPVIEHEASMCFQQEHMVA